MILENIWKLVGVLNHFSSSKEDNTGSNHDEHVRSLYSFLDSISLEELQEIQALVMLGKSNYEDERWYLIRKDVGTNKDEIVGYLDGIHTYLIEYLKEGFIRFIAQAATNSSMDVSPE